MTIDSGVKILATFDPGAVTSVLQLWREATDMKMPLRDDFKIHFMANRRTLLEGYVKAAGAIRLALSGLTAQDEAGKAELAKVHAELDAFSQWAKDGVQALDDLDPKRG
ncbi:hypothetical protein WQE_22678 [Paraburkholderia hospita]|uniref:Uncharacterized protein n=1 Tax=Paraburkholderia hospita TaxID=169430 RepID=A0ABP2PLN6_9BURK|nr:hypothetical protein [Paraburkholderia hospita]EIM98717.1 hypothetical protein WQE_22678 [Paraburkholderia hospita]OUL87700.1 hypothetical protein CA602_13260 [Paraburkholderia hospita]